MQKHYVWFGQTRCFSILREILALYFSSLMALFISQMTAVLLFLTAESADERLEAVMNRVPSLDCRNRPLSKTDWQRDWMNEFSSSASNRITMADIVYPNMKAFFAGKESFHILDANR